MSPLLLPSLSISEIQWSMIFFLFIGIFMCRGVVICIVMLCSCFLQENFTIKSLNLAWNGFGNDGALAMGEALKVNSTLKELDLTWVCVTASPVVSHGGEERRGVGQWNTNGPSENWSTECLFLKGHNSVAWRGGVGQWNTYEPSENWSSDVSVYYCQPSSVAWRVGEGGGN